MSSRLTLKRKRRYAGEDFGMGVRGSGVYKRRRVARRAFIPGIDRTGGFYGRYAGANAELKFHDFDLDISPVTSAGTITASLNLIAQGVTESTRVGRKCTIKSISIYYQLTLPESDAAATPAGSDTLRLIVFNDKQCNGATATILGILETANVRDHRNLANQGRFNIFYDKLHNIAYNGMASDGAGLVSQGNVVKNFRWGKKCTIPLEFDNTTGAVTEIRSNNLGIILISNQGTVVFNGKIRLRFSDGS